jgi:hypothetical protein
MKYFIGFLLVMIFYTGNSQTYVPMLNDYNEWQVTTCYFGCITDAYYTDGDTIVDNFNYKILDGYHYISRTFLLREDVNTQKVYLNYISNNKGEYLLYDFALSVGDSIDMKNPITPFPEDAGYYTLDSIVSKPLFNANHYDHYYLSPSESNTISTTNAVWIEGIGSLSIVNAPSGHPDINAAGHLSCAFKNGELTYSNLDSISACNPEYSLKVENFKDPLSNIILINSFSYNYFELKNTKMISKINIYDITGRKVKSFLNTDQSEIRVDIADYQSGNYFVKVITKNLNNRTFKIIKN